MRTLKFALSNQDHNHCGILPRSVVKQYMQLYGLWSPTTSPALLAKLEPFGMTRCVNYYALIVQLAP